MVFYVPIRFKMKNIQKYIILLLVCLAIVQSNAIAQDPNNITPCDNASILHQADSIKQLLISKGFVLLKEASLTMENQYEIPVVVSLNAGNIYEVVFIGDISSKIYEVRMFDWSERQVIYQKKLWGDVDGNIINVSYIPQFSEHYMIKVLQTNKKRKKDLCGYLMLLKKGNH